MSREVGPDERDRADRADRADRVDTADRGDSADRAYALERAHRLGRGARPARRDRVGRVGRVDFRGAGRRILAVGLAVAAMMSSSGASLALTQDQVKEVLRTIDDRQRNSGDYKAMCFIEQKERGKNDLVYQSVFYRRDEDDKLMILFLKPRSEAGKGYLRIDKNLFMYDPTVGKWERRTERERIMGTDSRRADFDESRLAEEYDAALVNEEELGQYKTYRLQLKAKAGVDVAYPVLELWVDQATSNVLKRQEFALSGRLMRTAYYPKWKKVFSESKKGDVYYPEEIRIFDEVEKGNSTTVVITKVDLRPLSANLFTKAWLESKSR